jgi:hypothetical protein
LEPAGPEDRNPAGSCWGCWSTILRPFCRGIDQIYITSILCCIIHINKLLIQWEK